jgi:hypothetical protein
LTPQHGEPSEPIYTDPPGLETYYNPEGIPRTEMPYDPERITQMDEHCPPDYPSAKENPGEGASQDQGTESRWESTSWDQENSGVLDDAHLYETGSLLALLLDGPDPEC